MQVKIIPFLIRHTRELIFQVVVVLILFLFYDYLQDKMVYNEDVVNFFISYKVAFFSNYLIAALVISYFLLPYFLSKRKFFSFFLGSFLLVALVILVDEFFLEKIYFPETRGKYFPGIFFTLLETLPLIIVFVGFKFAWDYLKKQKEIENLKSLVQQSELEFLKSQINPHFLFNNLNNLYAYASENSPKTPSIILELSFVLRYMLYDCKENFVSLKKELEHLKNYTALNELQIEDRGTIQFTKNIVSTDYLIAPLILNVFIENAFKHSTASQSENIKVAIAIDVNANGELKFSCKNSFSPLQNTKNLSKGIGLVNVKKRLELIYPNQHQLNITNTEYTYNVDLKIQLNQKEI